jgi:hypothetical protein
MIQVVENYDFSRIIHGKFPLSHEYFSHSNTKFKNYFRCSSRSREMLIDEKTETQKSHATVHLNIWKKQINLESARNTFVFNWQGSL